MSQNPTPATRPQLSRNAASGYMAVGIGLIVLALGLIVSLAGVEIDGKIVIGSGLGLAGLIIVGRALLIAKGGSSNDK